MLTTWSAAIIATSALLRLLIRTVTPSPAGAVEEDLEVLPCLCKARFNHGSDDCTSRAMTQRVRELPARVKRPQGRRGAAIWRHRRRRRATALGAVGSMTGASLSSQFSWQSPTTAVARPSLLQTLAPRGWGSNDRLHARPSAPIRRLHFLSANRCDRSSLGSRGAHPQQSWECERYPGHLLLPQTKRAFQSPSQASIQPHRS